MASAEKYILAIDHGTSGVKCALISIHGKTIGTASESTPLILLPNGGAEQDPRLWWAAFLKAAKTLIAKRLVDPKHVIAVCVS